MNNSELSDLSNIADSTGSSIICYSPTMISANGIWMGDNALDYSIPLFVLQMILIIGTTHVLVVLLKPFRQPRVISEIMGGVILGPSVLGRNAKLAAIIFPLRSIMLLETMANIGLLYFLFLVGVEMDIYVIRRIGKKAMGIAFAGMVLPFIIGCVFSFMLDQQFQTSSQGSFIIFLGVALSVTAFPVLARILAELKLLNTEIGRIAMSAALLNDMLAWTLLALAIALSDNQNTSPFASLWVVLSSLAFIAFCVLVVRPMIFWMIRRTPEGENLSELNICLILIGVMIAGFITDSIGTHAVFGAFIFGLVIPNGHHSLVLIDKLEDFVSGILLPLFFAISGLRTDIGTITGVGTWIILLFVTALSCMGKVAGTILVTHIYNMPIREGVTLGLLMNTKGLVEMIVLNVAKDQHVIDDRSFAIMVVVTFMMTGIIMPFVTVIYRPTKRFVAYKVRTIQKSKPDAELRVLVCIHNPRNVPTIINLLEISNPNKKSPICVYVLHLIELTGRASAMLIVHNTRKTGGPVLNRAQAQSEHIIKAFENYGQYTGCVSVQPLTAISPYSTMHEDVCNIAEDKRVSMIILPFHKQQTVDGAMETTNPAVRPVNQNVLANAPCSIGLLVDRGLNGSNRASAKQNSYHIAVLFFGGPDDREAISYAWRMSQHSNTTIHIIRFLPGEDAEEITPEDPAVLTVITDNERETQIDREYLKEFRSRTQHDKSITYTEKIVNNGDETVSAVRALDKIYDLYIVGRGQGVISPLTASLTDWSECPELGAIGDLLASSDFAATVSVLVVQQYVGSGLNGDGFGLDTPDSSSGLGNEQFQMNWKSPQPQKGKQRMFSP